MRKVSRLILIALLALLAAIASLEPAVLTVAIDGYKSQPTAECDTDMQCSQLPGGCLTEACGGPESAR